MARKPSTWSAQSTTARRGIASQENLFSNFLSHKGEDPFEIITLED
jgi:hypothetical protein